jgi:Tfp pilus assembly protein PilN
MRINLLPEEERPLKQSSIRWEFMVIFIGLVLLVTINTYAVLQSMTIRALQQEYDNALSYGDMLRNQYQQITTLQNENKDLGKKVEYYERLVNELKTAVDADALLSITEAVPEQLWLEAVILGENGVTIVGYTNESTLVTRYLQMLQLRGFEAAVNQLDQSTLSSKLFSFSITAQRRD